MEYLCERCGYSTNHKQNFAKHQNRKSQCPIIDKVEEKFPCKYCSAEYKHKQSRYRHEKTCSVKNNLTNLKSKLEENEKLREELKLQKEEIKKQSKKNAIKEFYAPGRLMQTSVKYVYLAREREFFRLNEDIYKIGKSSELGYKRLGKYPNNVSLN